MLLTAALASLGPLATELAGQEEAPPPDKYELYGGVRGKFRVSAGFFIPTHTTAATFASTDLGIGTRIVFEDILGLARTTAAGRLEADLRLGRRHQITAEIIRLNRSGSTVLGTEIVFPPDTFRIGLEVQSKWNVTLIPVSYRFSIIASERVDVGLGLGAFVTLLSTEIVADSAEISEGQSISLPLPVLGVEGLFALAPRLYLGVSGQVFSIGIEDISGTWFDLRTTLEYFPWRRFGFGAAFNWIDIRVENTSKVDILGESLDRTIKAEYRFRGPLFYGILSL